MTMNHHCSQTSRTMANDSALELNLATPGRSSKYGTRCVDHNNVDHLFFRPMNFAKRTCSSAHNLWSPVMPPDLPHREGTVPLTVSRRSLLECAGPCRSRSVGPAFSKAHRLPTTPIKWPITPRKTFATQCPGPKWQHNHQRRNRQKTKHNNRGTHTNKPCTSTATNSHK